MAFLTKSFKTLFGKKLIEPDGEGLIQLSKGHAMIHAGKAFTGRVENIAVASGASLIAHIIIPDNIEMHLKKFVLYSSGSALTFKLYEDPTITQGSSKQIPINRNRHSSNISEVIFYDDSTYIVGPGILLDGFSALGDKKVSIGFTDTDIEWVYEGKEYIFEIINDDNVAAIMWMHGFWYEERE